MSDFKLAPINLLHSKALRSDKMVMLLTDGETNPDDTGEVIGALESLGIYSPAADIVRTSNGFGFRNMPRAVADGVTDSNPNRTYHAFPSLIAPDAGTLIGSYCSFGNSSDGTNPSGGAHAARRGDLVIVRSTDQGKTWTDIKRLSCSNPLIANAVVVGDIEWRYGGLVDLGGGVIGCLIHKYTVTNASDLLAAAGNTVAWMVSTDGGDTWSEPQAVASPTISGAVASRMATAGDPCVWQDQVWLPIYATHSGTQENYCLITPLSAAVSNTSPSWSLVRVSSGEGNEMAFLRPVQNDDTILRVAIRRGADDTGPFIRSITPAQLTSPPNPWTEVGSWPMPGYVNTQPNIWRTPEGIYMAFGRFREPNQSYPTGGLRANLMWADSLLGRFVDCRTIPIPRKSPLAWGDYEKAMYAGFADMPGGLVGIMFGTEADMQAAAGDDNTNTSTYGTSYYSSSVGPRASMWFATIDPKIGALTPPAAYAPVQHFTQMENLRLMLLAENAISPTGGTMTWPCPISGHSWTQANATKPALDPSGSRNGRATISNFTGAGSYLNTRRLANSNYANLPTDVNAVYFLFKHGTQTGTFLSICANRCQIGGTAHTLNDPNNFFYTTYAKIAKVVSGAVVDQTWATHGTLLTSDIWYVLSYRQSEQRSLTDRLPINNVSFSELFNQASTNRAWDGSLGAVLAFNKNPNEREHAAILEQLFAL